MRFGAPHRHFRATDSTNTRARELAAAGAPAGMVVTAGEQTAGRGRQGRSWTAPPGKALLYSAIQRPLDERHLLLPLAAPLAVCEAAEALAPALDCAIKWPNDIWVGGRKLAGVLIEARMRAPGRSGQKADDPDGEGGGQDGWAVIGVGLNLSVERGEFPPELRDRATSIGVAIRAAGRPGSAGGGNGASGRGTEHNERPSRGGKGSGGAETPPRLGVEEARRALDIALERWVAAPRAEVLAAWRERDALRGRKVSWDGGAGVADGIDDSGDLVVLGPRGERFVLGAGEVHLAV